ncbi:MAG TPA: hypothetical protein VHM00_09045 [Caldimonas sp.]|nr:hypothetical protein [Caldimonas sp.]HEX2541216.1 hypothetical protein [Caldimonas sp.]
MQHVVEEALDANVDLHADVLAGGGSIAAYATSDPRPATPFWPLPFKNVRLQLLCSDFSAEDRSAAAHALNALLRQGSSGIQVERSFPLEQIATPNEHAEHKRGPGRVLLTPGHP